MTYFVFLAFLGAAVALPNGEPCPRNAAPYQVSLYVGYHVCNGALINQQWVLSAAQCANRGIRVYLGEYNIDVKEQSEQIIPVKRVIRHPNYSEVSHDSDIMLIKLETPATINSQVSTISLSKTCPTDGIQCLVSGWSNIESSGGSSPFLQCLDTLVLSESLCRKFYPLKITPNIFCLGFLGGNTNRLSCQDKIGAPAVCNGNLVGISKGGRECVLRNKPHLYTKVCSYVKWIENVIDRN